jgi:thiopeptide-type bacteriocin biosynthesis protein
MRAAGPLLVRATTAPTNLAVPVPSDLEGMDWSGLISWVEKAWAQPEVRDAVAIASPLLAQRLSASVETGQRDQRTTRRLARSLAMYLLRWQHRATPFGLFAGITTASVGPTSGGTVTGSRVVARPDAGWLHHLADQLEASPILRPKLRVEANSLAVERDGRLHLTARGAVGMSQPPSNRDVSVRLTRPVRAAMEAAREPVRLDGLAELLARASGATLATVQRMLDMLVGQRFLLSTARPATTAEDGLANVIDVLEEAGAAGTEESPLPILHEIKDLLRQHNQAADSNETARLRTNAAARMKSLLPQAPRTLAVDVRLRGAITVAEKVVEEAERAATVLLRLTTEPFGAVRWLDYHARFRARYGAGVLVPVLNLLSDSGLGYPTGFLDAPPTRPAWRAITDRDAILLNLLHRAALDGNNEVVLCDTDVDALTIGDHNTVIPPARCEIGFAIHAASRDALDRNDFLLRVTAAPEACTSLTGRFAHLLDPSEQQHLVNYLTTAALAVDRPVVAQMCHPAHLPEVDNVVRVPILAEQLIVLGEHPAPEPRARIDVGDLAVGADDNQMYLVQVSTGRRVVPVVPHALELTLHTPALARFLAEVADARAAVFRSFDFGAARTLDHTPRIRYRRTVLAPARWILHTDRLNHEPGGSWTGRLHAWRAAHRVPAHIVVATGSEHLPLDLDQPTHVSILRHLARGSQRIELHEHLPGGETWLGRAAELLVPMVPANPPARPLPALVAPQPSTPITADGILALRLTGNPARFDQLIADHLPRLAAQLASAGLRRWWLRRLRDLILPERDQSLAVTLHFGQADQVIAAMPTITAFVRDLEGRGLPCEVSMHPYHSHSGRYATSSAPNALPEMFAADTYAAVAQTRLARTVGVPAQALAAASLTVIGAALADSPVDGYRTLLAAVPYAPGRVERAIVERACALSDATDGYRQLRAAGGDEVADAWAARDIALAIYRDTLHTNHAAPDTLVALLRDHHARALGVDRDTEHTTRQIARRAAQRRLALHEARRP